MLEGKQRPRPKGKLGSFPEKRLVILPQDKPNAGVFGETVVSSADSSVIEGNPNLPLPMIGRAVVMLHLEEECIVGN